MRSDRRGMWGAVAAALVAVAGVSLSLFAQSADDYRSTPYLRIDPERTVVSRADGFVPCGECHTQEWEVWKESKHAQGFEDMHRRAGARDIMEQLDLRTTKRQEALCMRCHYTVGPNHRAVTGVSCESCHGPARDWMDTHNRYGDGITNPGQETPENRARRIAQTVEAGMLRPSGNIYSVAANCFECHTVPAEELVNQGGHSTGTSGFELVARIDEVRHNFLTPGSADASTAAANRPLSPERKRLLYVVGRILDYEYSLRGLAEAGTSGRYANAMGRRVTSAYRELDAVASVAQIPSVMEILRTGADLRLVHDNRAQLLAAAEEIRALGQAFGSGADAAQLGALDPLIAGERPAPPPPQATTDPETPPVAAPDPGAAGGAAATPTGGAAATGAAATGAAGTEAAATTATPPAPPVRPELPGAVRRRPAWFPAEGSHDVVGPSSCTSCHATAEDWWFADRHESTGQRLVGEDPKARRIAELYGIGAAGMGRGDQICSTCHATVDRSGRVVEYGVSCESCHGAGSGFLEPHEDGGNPQLGMTALKDASARAQTCGRCHHISDERLLAAGHPSGSDYDVVAATGQIEHWPDRRPTRGRAARGEPAYRAVDAAALRTAFQGLRSQRPVPDVTVVTLPPPASGGAPTTATGRAGAPAPAAGRSGAPASTSGRAASTGGASYPVPAAHTPGTGGSAVAPRSPRTLPPREGGASLSVGLDPLPRNTDEMTPEEMLLLVKERLERLYAALGRGN